MMKNVQKLVMLILIGMICLPTFSQNLPEVIAVNKIKLKEGVSGIEYSNSIKKVNHTLQHHARGLSMMLLYGDRGEAKGEMVQVWGFELKANRDYYFPSEDAEAYPHLTGLIEETGMNMNPNDPRLEGDRVYTDYVCLGFDKLVNPKGGEVVAMREMEVKEGKEKAFEDFVINTVQPAYQEHIDGMSAYVFKGDRGDRAGKYLLVYTFDTYERRNKYFPKEGEGGSDAMAKAAEGMEDYSGKWEEFMAGDPASGGYTDYVVVR